MDVLIQNFGHTQIILKAGQVRTQHTPWGKLEGLRTTAKHFSELFYFWQSLTFR